MGLWFFYDYKVGYPEKLQQYQEHEKYKRDGRVEEWIKYSAERGWPKEPDDVKEQSKVDEQLYWAVFAGALGLVSALYHVLSYPKKLTADATSFTPPWGPQIAFTEVTKIDRRPWKLKGLAKAYYTQNGRSKKASIDDLRFKGAEQVLARIQANFSGEILDLEAAPAAAEESASLPTE